ncbi:MAG: acyl-CoA dehydrogenase family protein [Chloroflexota bacterium]|nr:acyl-CoA dehydrogenase family protein [Chloroflexota bacterium]
MPKKSTRSKQRNITIDDVADVVASVADASQSINEDRQIPRELVGSMASQGLFRLLVPRSVGGEEIDLLDYLAITQAISSADGSMGWCLNQNNVLGTMASLMSDSLAKEVWADTDTILSNGPPQHASIEPAKGGYSLTGRWNFSSGSRHSTWVVAVGRYEDQTLSLIMPHADVEWIDSWQVGGLRGTGSFSFKTNARFVPAHRTWVEAKAIRREKGPLYLINRRLLFGAGFASVALGVARSALDEAINTSMAKTPQEQVLLRDQVQTQQDIGNAEALWGSCDAYLKEKARTLWEHACGHDELRMSDRIGLRLASTWAIRKAAEVVDIAYSVCGATSIFENHPIQRKFQDAHAITQQLQGRFEHYETAGQFYLGLEPQGLAH